MVKPLIYGKPNCSNCDKTKELFSDFGIEYDVVDITKDKLAMKKVKELGFREAPVVVTENDSWSGFQELRITNYKNSVSLDEDDDTWDF